ncbi:hypothetical protein KGF54_002948 [Candida jiufengensis]|uniref:uncharacterized protein n=1 Tax=Candida jiufengensis TaxID=497108 RepID=UPI0022253758|nr:uncharacterized protein KGF54_002948 [Candida jiufengensis]KAI5953576.1 hypothetical protein KGF54_002948 [Candida jiufengensis]
MLSLRYLSTQPLKRSSIKHSIPSLEEFIFNKKVKTTYKSILKQLYSKFNQSSQQQERNELVKFLKNEFKVDPTADLSHRKYLLSLGMNQIGSMASSLGLNIRV